MGKTKQDRSRTRRCNPAAPGPHQPVQRPSWDGECGFSSATGARSFLQLAILICFPLLVVLFSPRANENMRKVHRCGSGSPASKNSIEEQAGVQADRLKVGSAVSGIIMFQVVLLSLMGSNNAAREIAGERQILEKEKFGGVSPVAYLIEQSGLPVRPRARPIALDGRLRGAILVLQGRVLPNTPSYSFWSTPP